MAVEAVVKNCGYRKLLAKHPIDILATICIISTIKSSNNEIMKTRFHGLIGWKNILLFLVLAEDSCAKVNDVLAFAKTVMPTVEQIHVFLGGRQHYFLIGKIDIEPEQWSFFTVTKRLKK